MSVQVGEHEKVTGAQVIHHVASLLLGDDEKIPFRNTNRRKHVRDLCGMAARGDPRPEDEGFAAASA